MKRRVRIELWRRFDTGKARPKSRFVVHHTEGNPSARNNGDVVIKTIRLRRGHIQGWIEAETQRQYKARNKFRYAVQPFDTYYA